MVGIALVLSTYVVTQVSRWYLAELLKGRNALCISIRSALQLHDLLRIGPFLLVGYIYQEVAR